MVRQWRRVTKSLPSEIYNKKNVDIACWWDCNKFDGVPLGLPIKPIDNNCTKFKVKGVFCSWNCMRAYSDNMGDSRTGERASFIRLMMRRRCGVSFDNEKHNAGNCTEEEMSQRRIVPKLIPALPRWTLQMFGGPLTIQQFRSHNLPWTVETGPLVEDVHEEDVVLSRIAQKNFLAPRKSENIETAAVRLIDEYSATASKLPAVSDTLKTIIPPPKREVGNNGVIINVFQSYTSNRDNEATTSHKPGISTVARGKARGRGRGSARGRSRGRGRAGG